MTDPIVPAATKLAAKRGFIRTATQSLASVIPIAAITIPTTGDALLGVGLAAAGAVATAVLAGAASALSIISNGIPKDYADVTLVKQATIEPVEALANTDAAVSRVLLRRDLKGE
ncbi:hypothetical protein [Microbacterium sp. UCD-TDU]|uniref:hypothetical protein n=1 Tax=Microbacterium sp. UCD-TDU TaxID=1247714 RepID=UPI000348609E|nr:hypothetical protein [Microbacterium sp. UCD-TDU]EYT61621.1 hypothetical protein D514_0102060 [Microbacterium sp. UCD-TDU]